MHYPVHLVQFESTVCTFFRCGGVTVCVFGICCVVSCVLFSPPSHSYWSLVGCPMMCCMFVIGGSDEAGPL